MNFAFEKEFRRALDELVQIPDSRIGVAIPVRVSQLCNHRGRNVDCGFFDCSCQDVWDSAQTELGDVFEGPGICESVTSDDCSDARVAHAHRTWRAYKNILIRVTNEYDAVAGGTRVPANATFGSGNVTKATGVEIRYSEAISNYKLKSSDIQNCDCFHPSYSTQNKIRGTSTVALPAQRPHPAAATSARVMSTTPGAGTPGPTAEKSPGSGSSSTGPHHAH